MPAVYQGRVCAHNRGTDGVAVATRAGVPSLTSFSPFQSLTELCRMAAIHAHAPILPPHISCGYNRNPGRCFEHCREGEADNIESPSDAYVNGVKFLTPEAPDYATAREVYNAGVSTQPKVIA